MTDQVPVVAAVVETAPLTDEQRNAEILKQIEYYFSTENLIRDRYLNREMLKYPGNLVPLTTLMTFKKLQALSTDSAYIISAIAPSSVLILSEDKQSVGVAKPFARTVGDKQFENREEMTTFFKGLLAEHRENGAVLSDENKKIILGLVKHHPKSAEKLGSSEITSIKAGPSKEHADTFCFVLTRADGTEEDFSYLKCIANLYPSTDDKFQKTDRKRKEREEPAEKKELYVPGCILNFSVQSDDLDITKIKDIFNKYGTVKFVDIASGNKVEEGQEAEEKKESGTVFLRYIDAESAKAALADAECPIKSLRVLEGDEEKTYYEAHVIKPSFGKRGGRGGKRGGRGGRGGFKKSRND